MVKIFIVEDNENVREAAAGYLRLEGYEVEEFGEIKPARRALEAVPMSPPDLIVLDVMLPDGDGFMFAKQLKQTAMNKQAADVPIIFLTARDQESDRITGLELGADDYIVKPFSTRELVLRVKAVLKRTAHKTADDSDSGDATYSLEDEILTVSEMRHQIMLDQRSIVLTAAEWNILLFLAAKSPQVFNRLQILEYCLDSVAEGSERTVDTHIKNLRHKLGDGDWIETVRGFGYRFIGARR